MNAKSPAILAIELSTAQGKIAIVGGAEVLFTAEFAAHRSHNAKLFEPLQAALALAGNDLELIVVGLGPGSYTGVRIAIAAAQGIALSRDVRAIGLPSIIAPDQADHADGFVVIGDAKRGSYFNATISNGGIQDGIQLITADELTARLAGINGLPVITFDKSLTDSHGITLASPSAVKLAQFGKQLALGSTITANREPLEPIYLREAFITTPTRAWLKPAI